MDNKLHNRRHNGLGSSPLHGGGRKSFQVNEETILRGRWPSSSSSKKIIPDNSLADYLASDGLAELLITDKKKSKSKSNEKGLQFSHPFQETKKNNEDKEDERIGRKMSKENRSFGNSMRYIGKLRFPKPTLKSDTLLQPGRMSVDENALAAMRRKSTTDFNIEIPSTDSERSESTKGKSPRIPPRARTKDSGGSKSIDRAPAISKIAAAPIRRSSSSLTGNNIIQSSMSQWALSPGRRSHSSSVPSPPMMLTITDGAATATPLRSFSSLRPDGSSDHKLNNSNKKVVGNILTIGLDLFRKKTGTSNKPTRPSSPVLAAGDVEYQLSLLYNCLIRWRYANARSDIVNRIRKDTSKNALLNAWMEIAKMQTTVMEKKMQLQREKLCFKLNKMLFEQMNSLEGWGDIERQHMQSFSKTQTCLEAAVCRLPLVDKAKADPQLLSIRFRQATNFSGTIKNTLGLYTSAAEDLVPLVSELAQVVAEEKLLLEECLEMMADFSAMQIKEESLMSQLVQLKSAQLPVESISSANEIWFDTTR